MKYLMALLLFSSIVQAETNVDTCLLYMTTNHPNSKWTLQNDGQGTYIRYWNSTLSKPTMEQVYSNWPYASPWYSNVVKETKSEPNNWRTNGLDPDTVANAFSALIICINKRLPATNKITRAEFIQELKNLL